ncbi:glutathione peroxidase [Oceanimonas sp. CAM02]|uniref:glutathione peroxidase n=1 Tax=Oceanimonas sp. CAM02 TaxID=3080336 RepID=UPI002935BBCE|nr:glutathione peroxidase [Oceanimonas sp. CAM02]MDV2858882.1 glutathione peroxidase [Oceanimonas sp. CAM02]
MKRLIGTLCTALFCSAATAAEPDTTALYEHQLPRLHADTMLDMRQFAGQPMLVVNTASHCGFTSQFEGLEALHQQYKDKGLKVVGFPSNDFNQEAKSEEEAARVCFQNFGVTFDMAAPIGVKGDSAHPIFKEITRQSGKQPRWNFYKFVIDKDGRVTEVFSSITGPESKRLKSAIEQVL